MKRKNFSIRFFSFFAASKIQFRFYFFHRYRIIWSGYASSTWRSTRFWIWSVNCCTSPIEISIAIGGTRTTSTSSGGRGICPCIDGLCGKCRWYDVLPFAAIPWISIRLLQFGPNKRSRAYPGPKNTGADCNDFESSHRLRFADGLRWIILFSFSVSLVGHAGRVALQFC